MEKGGQSDFEAGCGGRGEAGVDVRVCWGIGGGLGMGGGRVSWLETVEWREGEGLG